MALSVLAVVVLGRLGDVLHDWSGERCRIMLYMTLYLCGSPQPQQFTTFSRDQFLSTLTYNPIHRPIDLNEEM